MGPANLNIQGDLDAQIGKIFRGNVESWVWFKTLLCVALFTTHVSQYMYFWYSLHGGAGESWVLGLARNAFRALRAIAPMTHKDMNEGQLQRAGAQEFGAARVTYGEEIDGC